MSGSSQRRLELRRDWDRKAHGAEKDLPWAKKYRKDPGRWLDRQDALLAARVLRDVNLNRWSPATRELVKAARAAVKAAGEAMDREDR